MSKKLYFLISFVLALGLAGSASAQDVTFWTDGSGNHLWCNPANWDNGLPEFDPDLTSWGTRGVDAIINIPGITEPVLIGPGCEAEAAWVGVGCDNTNTGPGVGLNMTGGTFSAMELTLGECDGGFGWMTMSGGTIDLVDYCYLAIGSNGGEGRLDMTGGEINALGENFIGSPALEWAGTLRLPKNEGKCEGNAGVGHIQLDGGTIRVRILQMAENGTMDITGGVLIITGRDSPEVQSWYGDMWDEVISEVNEGDLTAYDGNGVVGVVFVEYFDPNEPNEIWVAGRLDLGAVWFPMPYDGAVDRLRDVVLSWQPGDYVQAVDGHELYFGTSFAEVNSRSVSAIVLSSATYDAGQLETLELAKTYYWAVDEVNDATTWPGPVWNFTMDRGVAKNPDPLDGAEDVNYLGVTLSWAPGIDANDVNGHEVYFGTSWGDVDDANTSTAGIYRGPDGVLGPDGNDRYSYVVPGGDLPFALGETYFWRIDEVNGTNTWKGDVWSFDAEGRAKVVYPADKAGNIPALNLLLRWEAGVGAGSHEVYFGTSKADVTDANTNTAVIYRGPQPLSDVNYPVEDLEVGRPYYWRIDEVNTTTFVEGHVWSFTTGTFLIVDSFEWYETNQELRAVWKDYWSGSLFGLNGAEIKLMTVADDANMVLGGEKSLEYAFRNRNAKGGAYVGSEARADTANLEIGSDWTVGGVKALVVNFYGDPCNLKHTYLDGGVHTDGIHQDQLWVAVNDVTGNEGVVQYPDMGAIAEASWHTWNISLIDPCFNGVDMNNVANVYIGFGGQKIGQTKKGTGSPGDTVYFDDIRLYPPRCMPSITGIDNLHALGDFTEDCNTDYFDLEIMVRDWMITDGDVLTENRPAVLTDFPDETSHWTTDCAVGTGAIEANEGWNIDVNDPRLFGLESMSITAWVKQTIDNSWVGVVSSRESYPGCGDDASELGIYGKPYGGPDGLGYDWSCGTEEWTFDAGLDVPIDGTWTFIALSVDPTGATLYMRPTGSALQTGARNTDAHDVQKNFADHFTIGSDDKGGYFVGKIDDVRIYAYDLDFNDVNNLAYQAAEPNPPPVYWYKFDETSGLSAADSGTPTTVYGLVLSPANLVPKDPNDSEDPNLGTNAFDPNNLDIINFLDYRIMAEHWLSGPFLWPARP